MENIREFMKMFHMLNIILNYKKRETYTQWIVLSDVYKSLDLMSLERRTHLECVDIVLVE